MAGRARKHCANRTILACDSITPNNFAPYGTVIDAGQNQGRLDSQTANQGSARKWIDVTHVDDHYEGRARSGRRAKVVWNMFVCRPRRLREGRKCDVRVLERHAFTSQTFVPLGRGREARYLVIVAPTLPVARRGGGEWGKPYPAERARREKSVKERLLGARPNPFTNDHASSTTPPVDASPHEAWRTPKGTGEPDLENVQAFVVRGDQAVTYGPGTWHAPMVVLDAKGMEFVVVQYANCVGHEDCQELDILPERAGGDGLVVEVEGESKSAVEASKCGDTKAKL